MKREMITKPLPSNDHSAEKEWTLLELAEMKMGRRIGLIYRAAGVPDAYEDKGD